MCDALERMVDGTMTRAIFNVPPGTMKSLLVSVFLRAWAWSRNPALRFLCASYGSHLSIRDNVKLRTILQSQWFAERFPDARLASEQNAKERFDTIEGGWSIATSVGGVGTGEHPDMIIIDDPHTAQQARSSVERQAVIDWFDRTVSTRGVVRNARIAVIMQRLHEKDLTGHLLAKGGWNHFKFPMRYSLASPDPRDVRTEPGELLWPSLFHEERVAKLETDLGSYGAASQLQQSPIPEGGATFRREWFRVVDRLPDSMPLAITRFWDCASTDGAGDWTVGVRVARYREGQYVITDVVRGRWASGTVDRVIREVASRDGRGVRIREEQEPGSAGKTVVESRLRSLAGYNYKGIRSTGDKQTRWQPLAVQCEAGNISVLAGAWNGAFFDEMIAVPYAEHDDQADAVSGAFNDLALSAMTAKVIRMTGW